MSTVTTGKVRMSFVHVFEPHAREQGQEPKYSVTVLVPKSDTTTKKAIDAAIEEAATYGTSAKWQGKRPPKLNTPIHDGDGDRPSDGQPFGAECKGHWVFTASSKEQWPPEVVDANIQPILDRNAVYSGCYGRVSVNFFPYAYGGKKGVGCGLNAVQKLEDGEPLSGRVMAAEAFGTGSTDNALISGTQQQATEPSVNAAPF